MTEVWLKKLGHPYGQVWTRILLEKIVSLDPCAVFFAKRRLNYASFDPDMPHFLVKSVFLLQQIPANISGSP